MYVLMRLAVYKGESSRHAIGGLIPSPPVICQSVLSCLCFYVDLLYN